MGLLSEFFDYLHEQLENGSIYVWGAQGQNHETISENWIRRMETSEHNAERAIALWKKRMREGKTEVLRAFDCSGLIMYFLQNLKGVYDYDMASNTIKSKCQQIERRSFCQEILCSEFIRMEQAKAGHITLAL